MSKIMMRALKKTMIRTGACVMDLVMPGMGRGGMGAVVIITLPTEEEAATNGEATKTMRRTIEEEDRISGANVGTEAADEGNHTRTEAGIEVTTLTTIDTRTILTTGPKTITSQKRIRISMTKWAATCLTTNRTSQTIKFTAAAAAVDSAEADNSSEAAILISITIEIKATTKAITKVTIKAIHRATTHSTEIITGISRTRVTRKLMKQSIRARRVGILLRLRAINDVEVGIKINH